MEEKKLYSAPVSVKCYSGHLYAERPESFIWEGQTLEVQKVKKAWQGPGERHFLVAIDEGRTFELSYHEGRARWFAVELVGGAKGA